MLYRYEFNKANKSVGILVGMDEYFTEDEVFDCALFFEFKLECPTVDMTNTKSYFTDKGNRKFRKKIREIKKLANSKGVEVICRKVEENDLSNIVYKDNYQVVEKLVQCPQVV